MGSEIRNEFTILWRIVDFFIWAHDPCNEVISSPECIAENFENSRFHFSLCRENEKYFSCYLVSNVGFPSYGPLPLECTMETIDASGETLQSKTFLKCTISGYYKFIWKNFMTIDELSNKMKNWTEDNITVRCHIYGDVKTRQPKIECEARTQIHVDQCSCLWQVRKRNTSDWSGSKKFCFLDATPIHMTLSAPEDDVLINIQNKRKSRRFVACRISLVDISGNELYSQTAYYLFPSKQDSVWNFPAFFTKTVLEDNKDTLLQHDTFSLICNFSVPTGMHFEEIRYRTLPLVNASSTVYAVSSLQDDLHGMFTSKKHTDVKLRVYKEIFPVHKSLLAARSPVFSAMFNQDMLENRTGIVDIEDFDVKTANSFLEFMYTGTVNDMDYENASKLLTAAEKYQVLSLKEKCATFLMSILSKENVCEIIALSDMFGHDLLKATSLDYIKSHAGEILRSPQWLKWSEKNFKLATVIFYMVSTDIAAGK